MPLSSNSGFILTGANNHDGGFQSEENLHLRILSFSKRHCHRVSTQQPQTFLTDSMPL